jgi:putative transposase
MVHTDRQCASSEHGVWLKPSSMIRWHTSRLLRAHSADAVAQSSYATLRS